MTPERWRQITGIYHEAAARRGQDREAYLAHTCGGDAALRREIEALLAQDPLASFLATPATPPPGSRIGAYELLEVIGAGGMGIVYRARDLKLQRDVALKVLPEAVVRDPDRIARFSREATVLASLNHPNIGAIYGFEDSGEVHALVLELVEGPTLADRIAQGAFLVDEALPIAKQIAEALEAAHEQGIIHRDLKPANIKLRSDGVVKVLDFGLAKALEPEGNPQAAPGHASLSPSPAMRTGVGVLLGTAAYMSPEQARGRPADKRSDIWAFGCVFYEILTGTPAFRGASLSDTLASVLASQPNWSLLPSDLPPVIRRLLERMLEKEHAKRLADIFTLQFLLNEQALAVPVARITTRRHIWIAAAIALIAGIVGLAAVRYFSRPAESEAAGRITRLTITPSVTEAIVNGADRNVAISPDGTRVVWVGNNGSQLFIRALDQLESTPIGKLGGPRGLFFSPDGQSIGFFDAGSSIRTVATSGETFTSITRTDGLPVGASWGPDGTIVFATTNTATGLQRVFATGGAPTVLTRPNHDRDEDDYRWPQFLPGGRAILFTIATSIGGYPSWKVAVLDLETGGQKTILRGATDARYVSSGHLVYAGMSGALWAVGFDLARMEVTSTPVQMLPNVVVSALGAADFDVAQNGTLVYATSGGQAISRALVWVDRQGREEPIDAPPREYLNPRISPDGSRVAVEGRDGNGDIWIWNFADKTSQNLTRNPAADRYPVWTPDGSRVIFTSDRGGALNLFSQAADGSGTPERLTTSPNSQYPTAISPDGSHVVFHEDSGTTPFDLMTLALGHADNVRPLLASPSLEQNGDISPDGRWLAYQSSESGKFEISIRPFPAINNGQWQVSTNGGVRPTWARNGHELFYLTPTGALMSVPFEGGSTLKVGAPWKVIEGNYLFGVIGAPRTYDVSPDGRRFLMIKPIAATITPTSIVVVQNWQEELKRLVPTK